MSRMIGRVTCTRKPEKSKAVYLVSILNVSEEVMLQDCENRNIKGPVAWQGRWSQT